MAINSLKFSLTWKLMSSIPLGQLFVSDLGLVLHFIGSMKLLGYKLLYASGALSIQV